MSDSTNRVDAYIAKAPDYARPICEKLRRTIVGADAHLKEEIKWGAPAYSYKGLVCSLRAFKNHTAVWFHKGALLNDPGNVLEPGRKAHTMKQIRYTSTGEVNARALTALVRQAVELNEQGVRPERKSVRVTVPSALRDALENNPVFARCPDGHRSAAKELFASLAPSHRREWAQYVAEAKRPETVARRVKKVLSELSQGRRPDEKYRSGSRSR